MSALVHAIPVIESQTRRRVVLIGGLAVVCRLTRAYRATSDLDTVNRRRGGEAAQIELLIAHGATASGFRTLYSLSPATSPRECSPRVPESTNYGMAIAPSSGRARPFSLTPM